MPRHSRLRQWSGALHRRSFFETLEERALLTGSTSLLPPPGGATEILLAADVGSTEVPNNPPSGADLTAATLEDTPYTLTFDDFGFSDPLDSPPHSLIAVRISSLPLAGTLRLNGQPVAAGQVIPLADIFGFLLRYSPPTNAHGPSLARIGFQVQDNGGTANGGVDLDPTPNTLTISIAPVNDAPTGGDFTLTVFEDSQYAFGAGDFRFSDPADFPGNSLLSITVKSVPASGGLLLDGVPVVNDQQIPVSSVNSRLLRYQAPPNLNGPAAARIVFAVQDDGGTANGGVDRDPVPNTLTISIPSINDPPSGDDNTVGTAEDTPLVFKVADFPFSDLLDSPRNNLSAVLITALPDSGRLLLDTTPVVNGQSIPEAAIAAGLLRYVPDQNLFGQPLTSLLFQVQDDGGSSDGGQSLDPVPRTLFIYVTPLNDPPQAIDDTGTVSENGILDVPPTGLLFNDVDVDPGEALTITAVAGQSAAVGNTIALPSGARLLVRANGSYRYDPNGQFESLARQTVSSDTFTYEVTDNGGFRSVARVNITITGLNDAPAALNDSYQAEEDTPLVIPALGVLTNDSDIDGDSLAAQIASFPLHGQVTLRAGGGFTYTPDPDYSGTDHFTYRAFDGLATSNLATVNLSVANVNDRPLIVAPGSRTITEGTTLLVDGSFFDPDPNDTWTATVDYGNGPTPLALASDKTFSLSQPYPESGLYKITIAVRDALGLTGTSEIVVNVLNSSPQPLSLSGPQSAPQGESVTFIGQFTDPGVLDTFQGVVHWGDGTSTSLTPAELVPGQPFSLSHTYSTAGTFAPTLQITDDEGATATSSPATIRIFSVVAGAVVRSGVLEITGSPHSDSIALTLTGSRVVVNATYGGVNRNQSFPQKGIQRIVAILGAGDDAIRVDTKIRSPLIVSAGAGNDRVTAGGGPSIIAAGAGSDLLYGGAGRDVLIGGAGKDQLWGYGGSDLLIAGSTSYDDNTAALSAILDEWKSSRAFKTRAANLKAGSGPVLSGTSVALQPGTTVFDDAEVDSLMGNGDSDWFLTNAGKDKFNDKGELLN